jgi:hypothetical protein
MPFQLSCFIQLNVIKDTLMDGRHLSKIYKHVTRPKMTKNQPNLTHVVSIPKSQPS